jgi:hypothetical protein
MTGWRYCAKGKQGVCRWAEFASTPAPVFAATIVARHARVCILVAVPSLVPRVRSPNIPRTSCCFLVRYIYGTCPEKVKYIVSKLSWLLGKNRTRNKKRPTEVYLARQLNFWWPSAYRLGQSGCNR